MEYSALTIMGWDWIRAGRLANISYIPLDLVAGF